MFIPWPSWADKGSDKVNKPEHNKFEPRESGGPHSCCKRQDDIILTVPSVALLTLHFSLDHRLCLIVFSADTSHPHQEPIVLFFGLFATSKSKLIPVNAKCSLPFQIGINYASEGCSVSLPPLFLHNKHSISNLNKPPLQTFHFTPLKKNIFSICSSSNLMYIFPFFLSTIPPRFYRNVEKYINVFLI